MTEKKQSMAGPAEAATSHQLFFFFPAVLTVTHLFPQASPPKATLSYKSITALTQYHTPMIQYHLPVMKDPVCYYIRLGGYLDTDHNTISKSESQV